LATSAAAGYAEVVKTLLEGGCDVTEKTVPDGLTPLMNAAESGSVDTLKYIIDYINKNSPDPKAEINHLSNNGLTALILASANNKTDAVVYLIDQGADLDPMHESGINALMYASAMDSTEIVKILIERGADINKKHANGGTALLEACAVGAKGAVELLVGNGQLKYSYCVVIQSICRYSR
jgi:ankyrin repeat protein